MYYFREVKTAKPWDDYAKTFLRATFINSSTWGEFQKSSGANFTSIGNTGISLDGDSLLGEGQSEKEKLEEELREEEAYEGSYMCLG